jgi:ATP-binding protein involved in chromosome partitioning
MAASGAVNEQQIRDALRQIADPDRQKDIVSLDMVSGLTVKDGHVAFAIEVEPERGPRLESLRKAAEKAVFDLPGVLSVTAVLTAHRGGPGGGQGGGPAQSPAARPGAPHGTPAGRAGKILVPSVRSIVAVASGKGGVGKSTTATNLAVALATQGRRVGMLDADIYGPSQPRMMGLAGRRPQARDDKILIPLQNYGVKCMSIGFMLAEDTPMIWRGPMVTGAIEQMLRDVEWGELDILVCDLPPGTGDAQLTMAQKGPLTGAVIVSTTQDIELLDARKRMHMFRKVAVPVLGMIENMSYFLCPHCGERSDIFTHGGARREAERLGTEFLGEVPLDMAIRETSDDGRPIVVTQPDGPHAKTYQAIAARVWDKVSGLLGDVRRQAPRIVIQ